MRPSAAFLIAILASAALSGCLGGDDETGPTPEPSASHGPPTAVLSVAPDANVTQDANGTFSALAGVNITFDGAGSAGHEIAFGWDLGDGTTVGQVPSASTPGDEEDNGTAGSTTADPTVSNVTDPAPDLFAPEPRLVSLQEPNATGSTGDPADGPGSDNQTGDAMPDNDARVVHAFGTPGNFTVTLWVTDHHGAPASDEALFVVMPAGPPSGTVYRIQNTTYTTNAVTNVQCGAPQTNKQEFVWALEAGEPNGTPSVVINTTIILTPASGQYLSGWIIFYDPEGNQLATSMAGAPPRRVVVPGPLPAGDYVIEINTCQAVNGSGSVVASATYAAP